MGFLIGGINIFCSNEIQEELRHAKSDKNNSSLIPIGGVAKLAFSSEIIDILQQIFSNQRFHQSKTFDPNQNEVEGYNDSTG
jgi:hypothetical protein